MRLSPAGFILAFVGCGGFSSGETTTPAVDAGAVVAPTLEAGVAPTPEAGAPADASAGPTDAGCVVTTVMATLDADTELAACNNGSPDGNKQIANISTNGALFRFTFSDADAAALTKATILGGTLHLIAQNGAIGGAIEAHVARNDWDEGEGDNNHDGCDVCRRTSDDNGAFGWGTTVVAWNANTMISSPADYAPASTALALPQGATDVSFAITASAIPAFPAAKTLSFFVKMTSGSMGVITKELAHGVGAATFALDYCK